MRAAYGASADSPSLSTARCADHECRAPATHMCERCGRWFCDFHTILEPVRPGRRLCADCFENENPIVDEAGSTEAAIKERRKVGEEHILARPKKGGKGGGADAQA